MIAVTFALPAESSDFIHLLGAARRVETGGINTTRGTLHGQEVTVMHTGVGEAAVRRRLAAFLDAAQPDALIAAGFAGALSDSLAVGDLLLAENFGTADLFSPMRKILEAKGAKVGALTTAHEIIDSLATRRRIAEETGAAGVDMETEFINELCAQRGVPMLSLRAITDTPRAPFPAPPGVLFNLETQRTEFLPLFRFLLTHPLTMPRFLGFARTIAQCRRRLADSLDLLCQTSLS